MKLLWYSLLFSGFILPSSNGQSINNVGLGLPDNWHGDTVGVLDCPATNIPSFLDGYFFCQLSAAYGNDSNPDGQRLDHMIDAVGAVGSFHIQDGKVTFFSQYYPSVNYKIWDFYNRDMRKSTVAWDVSFSYQNTTSANLWNKIPKDDNTLIISPSVDFWKFGEDIIAGTEEKWVGYKLDVPTLTDFTLYPFVEEHDAGIPEVDSLSMGIHEHIDADHTFYTGFSALGSFNGTETHLYQGIYTFDANKIRKIAGLYDFGVVDTKQCSNGTYLGDPRSLPGYMHSITGTANYVILPITSMLFNFCAMFVKSNDVVQKSISPFQWFDNVPLRFLIFDKRSKKFVTNPLSADTPMFVTHQLNAYEDAHGNLIADMITYNNADPYLKDLYRDYLLTRNHIDPNTVSRFTINTQKNATKNVVTSVIQDTLAVEFSNINFAYKTKPYSYAYMVKNLFTPGSSIIKINVNNINASGALEFQPGKTIVVHEPIYVAKPDSKQEDDGILLVRGIDVSLEQSILYVVDALTMTEIGHATVPMVVPFGFHNRFYSFGTSSTNGTPSTNAASRPTSKLSLSETCRFVFLISLIALSNLFM